jgi:hypothetical protein
VRRRNRKSNWSVHDPLNRAIRKFVDQGAPVFSTSQSRNLLLAPVTRMRCPGKASKSSAEANTTADALDEEDISLRDSMRRYERRATASQMYVVSCFEREGRCFYIFLLGLRPHTHVKTNDAFPLSAAICDIAAARATWERWACARYVEPSASSVPCASKDCGTGI